MCNCPVGDRVKYATGTFEDSALTWWNAQVQLLGIDVANATTWDDFKELIRKVFCPRDEIQKQENEYYDLKMVGSEIEIVHLAHKITDQEVESGSLPPRVSVTTAATTTATTPVSDDKRKWSDTDKATSVSQSQKKPDNNSTRSFSQSSSVNQNQNHSQTSGYVGKQPKCNKCGLHHYGPCGRACQRCGRVGHMAKDCRAPHPANQHQQSQHQQQRQQPQQNRGNQRGCYQCGNEGHFKKDCPQLNQNANNNNGGNRQNNNGGNNNGHNGVNNGNNGGNGARGRVFTLGAGDARNDGNVVTDTFSVNGIFASILFDFVADWSYVSLEFGRQLGITPTPLKNKHVVELADGKSIEALHVLLGCKLDLLGQVFDIDLLPITLGSFDIVVGMDWLSKHRADILCKEKIVCVPLPSGELLSVQGHRSGATVNIISSMKAQKCLRKGYPAILALVTDTRP
ncbi:homeobox protein 2-like [Helianthus annuus]|uniref:homeobox protein 2-like n=1 Tax=Helianthus annuus TaxID=4232 RepID=UPI000B8FDF57|nr:homeobox protein 2-like [Helianthus annuus]